MARVNIDILGISELKWTGMGEFYTDDHYIYYCGQEAKTQKQSKCPLTEEWIKKIWYIYTMEYYSVTKKNEVMLFATWMDLESGILSEVSQTKKEKYYMTSHICGI